MKYRLVQLGYRCEDVVYPHGIAYETLVSESFVDAFWAFHGRYLAKINGRMTP